MKKLDLKKLKILKTKGDGAYGAQCPACAQTGGDKKGQHLHIYESGAFGCAVDKSKEHKKLIGELAGMAKQADQPNTEKKGKLRINRMVCPPIRVLAVFGRRGRLFSSAGRINEKEERNDLKIKGFESTRPTRPDWPTPSEKECLPSLRVLPDFSDFTEELE
jgi:hypothetical protein